MITAPYIKERNYDELFEKIIIGVKDRTSNPKKNDDFMIVCTGVTGSGKTALMQHGYELYDPNCHIDFVCLKRGDFAKALYLAKNKSLPRFVGNDEANVSKRDALTKYNKDLLDLYFSIRGKNIFHWWNNPSIDMIDKAFIQEKLNGVIFVATKSIDKPRVYYYFRKKDILKIFEKHGQLKLATLKKYAKKYAYYKGWFKDYKGKLLKAYLEKKDSRMDEKIDEFYEKYGDTTMLTTKDMRDKLQVTRQTLINYEKELSKTGKINIGEHIVNKPNGRKIYTPECLEIFRKHLLEKATTLYGNGEA